MTNFFDQFFWKFFFEFWFFGRFFLTYNLLTIASFRIGVPSILFNWKLLDHFMCVYAYARMSLTKHQKWEYWLSTKSFKILFPVWYDSPTVTALDTMTYPIEELTFPTITICPQNSNPDRWGPTIKTFDNLEKRCPNTG